MKRLLVLLVIAALGLTITPTATAAQDFNVGDRVEVDPLGIDRWVAGVVIAEDASSYLVRTDPERPGMSYGEYTIPKTGSYADRIRPSTKPLPDEQKVDKRQPTGILDCPIEKGIYASRLSTETAKQMVRCLSEYYEGDDYASRVDIRGFRIGKPRLWQPYSDIGPGTRDTLVYPIRVTATQLWWTAKTVEERRWIKIYDCYFSTLDYWICGLHQRVKEWPSIKRPRP